MKKSQRLQTIVDLKARQENKDRFALAEEQEKRRQKEAQLNNLISYREDYLKKNEKLLKSGISVMQLMEFRAFIEKIEKAIAGEEAGLLAIDNELGRLKKAWEEAHHQTHNMQKIQTNAQIIERKQSEKKEQLEMDDQSAMRMAGKNGMDSA